MDRRAYTAFFRQVVAFDEQLLGQIEAWLAKRGLKGTWDQAIAPVNFSASQITIEGATRRQMGDFVRLFRPDASFLGFSVITPDGRPDPETQAGACSSIRFAHVSIVACDWRLLAKFYEYVLGCELVVPYNIIDAERLERASGTPRGLRGMHLRLPGHGKTGPTIDLFSYEEGPGAPVRERHAPGIAHLAFEVSDVQATCEFALEAGGRVLHGPTSENMPGLGKLTSAQVADPEGNVVELQRWS
jgi:catechol 2,3-dioxygenase-like lactoylglutathione lyase family enzyme